MNGYIKYFDDGGKKCFLKLKMITYNNIFKMLYNILIILKYIKIY